MVSIHKNILLLNMIAMRESPEIIKQLFLLYNNITKNVSPTSDKLTSINFFGRVSPQLDISRIKFY